MIGVITQLIEATDCRTCDRIVENNLFKVSPFERSRLCTFATHAKMRILRIEQEKKLSWSNELN